MSFLSRDKVDQLIYERSKAWASFFDNHAEEDPEATLDINAPYDWGERYYDDNAPCDSSLEAEEVDVPEDATLLHNLSLSKQSAVENKCLQVTRWHDNTLQLDKEDMDLVNETRSLLAEHDRRWEAAGIFKILNTFDMANIKKVGRWIQKQCERKRRETLLLSSDSDSDSVHSPHRARWRCNRPRMYSAIKTTVRKKYIVTHGQHACCGNTSDFSDSSPQGKARHNKWHYADCNSRYAGTTNKVTKIKMCSCQRRHQLSQSSSSAALSSLLELLSDDPRLAKQVCDKLRTEKRCCQRIQYTRDLTIDETVAEITYVPPNNKNAHPMIPQPCLVKSPQFDKLSEQSHDYRDAVIDLYPENSPRRAKQLNEAHAEMKPQQSQGHVEYKPKESGESTKPPIKEVGVEGPPKGSRSRENGVQAEKKPSKSHGSAEYKPKDSGERTKPPMKGMHVEEPPKGSRGRKNAYAVKSSAKSYERGKHIKEAPQQKKQKESYERVKDMEGSLDSDRAKASNEPSKKIKETQAAKEWNEAQSESKATKQMKEARIESNKCDDREMENKSGKSHERPIVTEKAKPQKNPKESSERPKSLKETQGAQNPTKTQTKDEAQKNKERACKANVKYFENEKATKAEKAKKGKNNAYVKKSQRDEERVSLGNDTTFNRELQLALKISSASYEIERKLQALKQTENGVGDKPNGNHAQAATAAASIVQRQTAHAKPSTAQEHDISAAFAFKKPQPVSTKLPKKPQPTSREETFLKDSANMCNSTALSNTPAASRAFSEKTQNETTPQAPKSHSYEQAIPSIKTSAHSASKSLSQQADATKRCQVATLERSLKPPPILVYKPDDRPYLPEQSFVGEKFVLTEAHLSTIIGAAKAQKFFKQWKGRRMFDASDTLFYREGEDGDNSSSDSDEDDPLCSFNKVGKIYHVPLTSRWETITHNCNNK